MSKDKQRDLGVLGDDKCPPKMVLTHDQIKVRCKRFLTKLIVNKSPKELADYLFELAYYIAKQGDAKRLDVAIEVFDEKYHHDELPDTEKKQ